MTGYPEKKTTRKTLKSYTRFCPRCGKLVEFETKTYGRICDDCKLPTYIPKETKGSKE